jgi:hypothetical protein
MKFLAKLHWFALIKKLITTTKIRFKHVRTRVKQIAWQHLIVNGILQQLKFIMRIQVYQGRYVHINLLTTQSRLSLTHVKTSERQHVTQIQIVIGTRLHSFHMKSFQASLNTCALIKNLTTRIKQESLNAKTKIRQRARQVQTLHIALTTRKKLTFMNFHQDRP